MKLCGFVNESACLYFLIKRIKEKKRNSVLFIEDDIDISLFCKTALALKDIFEFDFDIVELDLSIDSFVKTSKKIFSSLKPILIITSIKSLDKELFSYDSLFAKEIKIDETLNRTELLSILSEWGFKRTDFVEQPGEFAVRGSVIDIFNPGDDYPVRLYFDDKVISAIKKFEIDTQNTFDFLTTFKLTNISRRNKKILDFDMDFYSYDLNIDGTTLLSSSCVGNESFSFENISFANNNFILELKDFVEKGYFTHIYYLNEREATKIASLLDESGIKFRNVFFHQGYIRKGFYSKVEKIFIVSSNEIFSRDFIKVIKKEAKKTISINQISKGDYVVHDDYGIGIYNGVIDYTYRDEWGNTYVTECIEIIYQGGDKLYVALNDFKKIEKYIGDSEKVKLSSLSSTKWSKVKEKVRKEVEKIAAQIIKTEARRKILKIEPMVKTDMEDDFVLDFLYEETPDQKRAIEDVLRDLESGSPANRVVIGDVGFGKTEVAMRAAFRAVSNGFQVCVLCPTTILVEQHFRTFSKRFEKFPFNIRAISRFTPFYQEKKIKDELKKGVCDIVIGTHKLLNKDVEFKNLRVLIIDEEHKFGVEQKEIIKNRYSDIHVFYLSATPIPRTLYQALSIIRDMSIIETPPLGRLPIETRVCPYDENIIVEAVDREIKRGGQIFYVYNRVEFINSKFEKLSKLLGGVKICVVHGKMKGEEIERVMYDFLNRKYDLMLSSTIIESGIDIPSVNTLIVEDAHKLGLAQAYQLRGRIGREKTKAFCYFFYPKYLESDSSKEDNFLLSKDAVKRLRALEEFSELGSGFRLSMRDLEIRGSGEILGTRQHGFISAVGIETYVRLLNDEISKIKGIIKKEAKEPVVDIKISAYIPSDYINDDMERLIIYRKLSNSGYNEIDDIVKEVEDLAGPMPYEVKNLIRITKIKRILSGKGVVKIVEKNMSIEFYFEKWFKVDTNQIIKWQNDFKDRIQFFKTKNYDGLSVFLTKSDDKISIISKVFGLDI